ncbi:glycoside hydrolase family protein [Acinetobacter sp. B5B]|uniref:glycoside hydrolase family protein n=1 Tax=Acinetobacter TaxID=469 RepID=UPI0018A2B06C|nr:MULTISPECIES: glycoside hydrolase family protein [Acinetobacter]MBF7682952.1 glycoside hydrolase family protein [Acinetobacter baretiae]MBF7696225.1 glycoside hydrolase family protein [Acinetobacter rathckeae]
MNTRDKVIASLLGVSGLMITGVKLDEGYTSKPQIPTKGDVPTLGHGTTVYPNGRPVKLTDKPITREKADLYLRHHVSKIEKQFKQSVPNVALSQAEYDVYIDFVYQFGIGTFQRSSIRSNLIKGNYIQACKSLLKYRYTAGRDCSVRSSNCYGVYTRQLKRYDKCMESN